MHMDSHVNLINYDNFNSPLQETVHVRELLNSNMCFVCVNCLSVCVFLLILFGVIGTGCTRRVLLYMSGMFNY